jgi:phenylalanine-4-hydroxylase
MFQEGQLYSPVTMADDGSVTVHLADNHPGKDDPEYMARRNEIASAALSWEPGQPLPVIEYTEEEHEVWRTVSRELAPKHERLACQEYLEGVSALKLPTDHIPQLGESSAGLEALTGFRYEPAAGIVPLRDFYGALGDGVFHSTQYIRYHEQPLYTPEPDMIHEVIGHGNMLASPKFAELKRLAGKAAQRCETKEGLQFLADCFWFTMEFGVVRERGDWHAYGAGILSSYGEIDEFRECEIRPIDLLQMGTIDYDITHYQPVLFGAESMQHLVDTVGGFFAGFDDDTPARLKAEGAG